MSFYIMYAETCVEEYVSPGEALEECVQGCYRSEFQFLDKKALEVEIGDNGGLEFPDFLLYGSCVPLVSEKFRQVLEKAGADNLFYKRVFLTSGLLGLREPFWLALPPRIRCLDRRKSVIEVEENEYCEPDELQREAVKIVIDPRKTGNYKIFKLPAELDNQEIIVTEELKKAIEASQLENVHFAKIQEA